MAQKDISQAARLYTGGSGSSTAEMSSPLRDPQKYRVYRWEEQSLIPFHPSLTEDMSYVACLRFVEDAYGWLGISPPQLVLKRRWLRQCSYLDGKITLANWGRKPLIILHEMAHDLVDRRHGDNVEPHGPEYVRFLIDLLDAKTVLNQQYLCDSVRAAGLRFSDKAFSDR